MDERERIEALEIENAALRRTVRLFAETTRDALTAIYDRDYGGLASHSVTKTALNAALGRFDAVLIPLGVGAPSTRDGGEAGEGCDGTMEGGPR